MFYMQITYFPGVFACLVYSLDEERARGYYGISLSLYWFHFVQHGRRFYHGIDRCVNRCCQNNPCLEGGTCQEICEPTTVRFNCSCPPAYTGQRCEALKHPRNCKDIARNGAKISGRFRVFDSQDLPFIVYCDLTYEPDYVWTLIQSFSYGNNDQFKVNRFGLDLPVNEEESTINWSAYRLSLSRMRSLAVTSTHFRATCNFPDDGLVYTDYARAKLEGHDLFGKWFTQCRLFEYLNIRDIECYECTAGTWQYNEMWHVNSERSVSTAGCEFNGEAGAVPQEQNFGLYVYVNVNFRCTSGQNSTSQHWIGSRKWNVTKASLYVKKSIISFVFELAICAQTFVKNAFQ